MTDEFRFPFERLEVWQLAVDLADFILGPSSEALLQRQRSSSEALLFP